MIPLSLKKQLLERDGFQCQKCSFKDLSGSELEIHHINPRVFKGSDDLQNLVTLCTICHKHAPDDEKELLAYISDKIDSKVLDTFRKSNYSISKKTKEGMNARFKQGLHITKAPLGYHILNKKLSPAENSHIVREIFQNFLWTELSLTQFAKKYSLTVGGLKKILSNETYLGKIKFDGQLAQGNHFQLVSQELFE